MQIRSTALLFALGALLGCTGGTDPGSGAPARSGLASPEAPGPADDAATPSGAPPSAPAHPRADLPPPGDSTYGVYLNGHKVGWMRNGVTIGHEVELSLELHASVGGLGTVSKIELEEHRAYDASSGALLSLSFEQKAATGAMSVLGIVRGNELDLNITAGGHTTTQQATVAETLEDAMATYRLAAHPEVGRSEKAQRFDASVLRLVSGEHRVVAVEQRMLGGVSTQTVQIESRYPDLGITESSWLDNSGTVLESRVGGFFVARLEPPDVAKQLDYSQDLLVSAVVAAPPSVAQGTNAVHMELDFRGFDDGPPPTSDRQKVAVQGDVVRISLTRDVAPTQALGGVDANDPMLATTPFIQSDHPAIRNKAREVAGDAKDLFTAVRRLTAFVFDHVRDEYVPAYSNALEALQTARGDCTEHSILFVALARALGIPARVAVGIAYWAPGNGFGWHAWAEVRAGARWIAVDPTWNQPIADVTHVKLADGGPAEQARIVMLLGRLRIVAARVNDG